MAAEWGIHRAFMMRKLARQGVTIKGRPEAACHCDAGSGPGLFADSGSAKRDRRLVAAAIGPAFVGPRRIQLYQQSVAVGPSRQRAGVPKIVGIDVHVEDLPHRQKDAS
jgi:hypothetical protein